MGSRVNKMMKQKLTCVSDKMVWQLYTLREQWVCRVPKHTTKTQKHSAKDLPCVTHGKQRTAKLGRHFGHSAKPLPCVLFCRGPDKTHGKIKLPRPPSMPRGLFAVCHMVRHTANNATFAVCHMDRHTAKNGSFVVCLAMAHGKKWWHTAKLIFKFLFFV